MAGRIPQSFIDELIARVDIVELIGSRVALKKAGREYKACCPFHDEKTASFCVSPDKQFYHCFGCGAHGTALGFLMEYDRLAFPEAVEELATRLNLPVPHEGTSARGAANTAGADGAAAAELAGTSALYRLLAEAADFYRSSLEHSERARAYAARRGLSREIIERFAIGYAPDSWNELLRRFGGGERAQRELVSSGLAVEREPGAQRAEGGAHYYDRFRDRLMFPIRDTRGRVIGFGGRVIDGGEPKYMNSPETALFHKGKELYGLYETRLARASLKRLLVVEGYMDCVRLHQAGLTCAVATLGTATTPEHLRLAFRLVSELIFAFDGDRAGRAAAWRALQTVLPEVRAGREIRFLFLPEGEDPDSLVGREGAERFEARLGEAVPLSEYLVAHLAEEADIAHADGKARFIALARPLWERLAPGVYRELLLERIAGALQLPAERLQQWFARPETSHVSVQPPVQRARIERPRQRPLGRGSLVTQAIALLLHFPAAANAVSAEQRAALASLKRPGVAALAELLEQQSAQPAATVAQILERWRARHEYQRLGELAATAALVPDEAAARCELSQAVERLLDRELRHGRLEVLIEKARLTRLEESEKLELQALIVDQNGSRGGSSRHDPQT